MYKIDDEVTVWYDGNRPVRGVVCSVKHSNTRNNSEAVYKVAISGYTDLLSFYESELDPEPDEDLCIDCSS
jgi:hypothetical protein